MHTALRSVWFAVALAAVAPPTLARADWPTLHRDYQRSGHTAEALKRPIERKWFRSFVEEKIGPRSEAIVAEGLCFVGTYAGNLYALDVRSGETVWHKALGGAIGHSPCYDKGRLYVCTDEAYDRGSLVCLRAKDGAEQWRYRAAAGIWNSPACDGRRVYVGDRSGVFHAVDAASGQRAWTFATGAMILKPASFSPDGRRIVVGSEDMHVYCLSPEGALLWKSPKLAGVSQRDAAPTIWDGKVILRTNPSTAFHHTLYEGRRLIADIQRQIPLDTQEDVAYDKVQKSQYFLRRTDRRERAEYEGILKFLKENPHYRTWFTFNLDDGREPWITSVLFTTGLHNPPTPPTFNTQTGELYTTIVTSLGVYCDGVSQVGIGIGRIDPKTGYVTNLPHAEGDRVPGYFAGMTMIADETSSLSLAGDFLLSTHQGAVGGVDLKTRKLGPAAGARDSYGGLYGPGVHGGWDGSKRLAQEGYVQNMTNEWHGPDRAIVAISDDRMFWVVGGCVVCLAGPDVRATDSGGKKAPAPWKWSQMPRLDGGNLTSLLGGFDESVPRTSLDMATIEKCLAAPPSPQASGPIPADATTTADVKRRLDAAVTELVDGAPWAAWIVQLGICQQEYHFTRTAETIQAVALALPYLSPPVRAKAVAYLDRLVDAGAPLGQPMFKVGGRRREHYDLAPALIEQFAAVGAKGSTEFGDLYALWAYAHYADRWPKVLGQIDAIVERFGPTVRKPIEFNPEADGGNAVEGLNRQLAGAIAYGRLMARAGKAEEQRAAAAMALEAANQRVHFEKADRRLQTRRAHYARIPRYAGLTPEIGRLLTDHAGKALRGNLDDLDRELPVWRQAWGERLIGGENYISPPHLARVLFLAHAYGPALCREALPRFLDQPWCKADVYYIEKLSAMVNGQSPNRND